MSSVYRLTLRQLSGRWRLLITLLLAALPVVMGVMWRLIEGDSFPDLEYQEVALNAMLAGAIIPLITLAIATAAFSNEVEDRTLANLTLSPIPRWQIVVPKLLGSLTIGGIFLTVSALATSYIVFSGDMTATIAITAGAVVAIVLYTTVFLWAGLLTTRSIAFGLLYVFLWEGLFSQNVTVVRFLSIRHYAITLMHRMDDRLFADGEHLSTGVVIGAAASVFVIFLLLAIRRLRTMDVP